MTLPITIFLNDAGIDCLGISERDMACFMMMKYHADERMKIFEAHSRHYTALKQSRREVMTSKCEVTSIEEMMKIPIIR